jgi:hypothetical protein
VIDDFFGVGLTFAFFFGLWVGRRGERAKWRAAISAEKRRIAELDANVLRNMRGKLGL